MKRSLLNWWTITGGWALLWKQQSLIKGSVNALLFKDERMRLFVRLAESINLFFLYTYVCGCLNFKCPRSCWLNIRAPNVTEGAPHCKNYTSIIKLANLFLSSSPLWNPKSPISSPLFFQLGSVSPRLVFDELYKYHPNGKSASWYRHGTDSCLWRRVCMNTHTAKTKTPITILWREWRRVKCRERSSSERRKRENQRWRCERKQREEEDSRKGQEVILFLFKPNNWVRF